MYYKNNKSTTIYLKYYIYNPIWDFLLFFFRRGDLSIRTQSYIKEPNKKNGRSSTRLFLWSPTPCLFSWRAVFPWTGMKKAQRRWAGVWGLQAFAIWQWVVDLVPMPRKQNRAWSGPSPYAVGRSLTLVPSSVAYPPAHKDPRREQERFIRSLLKTRGQLIHN